MKKITAFLLFFCLLCPLFCGCSVSVTGDRFIKIGGDYENAKDFSEGFAAVKKDGRWGYINADGEQTVDFRFEDALKKAWPP